MSGVKDQKSDEFFFTTLQEYDNFIICSETDLDGNITFASKCFCDISGYKKEELIGRPHNIVRDPNNPKELFSYMWKQLKQNKKFTIPKMSNKAKDGTIYYVDATFSSIYENDILIGYRSLRKDITSYVQLGKLNDKLASENIHLDLEKKAIEKDLGYTAKEKDMFRDDMISMFTHELRTPLNAIINFSDYIQRNLKKELTSKRVAKLIDLTEKIYTNALVQKDMIDTTLDLAAIKAGKLTLHKETVGMYNFMMLIVNRYQGMYNKNIIVEIEEDIVGFIDKKICGIVVANLLSNGLKYSKTTVLLRGYMIQDNFHLVVEDDGDGIKEKYREKIFDPFQQTQDKSMLKMEMQGTGIGLQTVKRLTELCNKTITINNSKRLGGASFTISERERI